MWSVLPSVMPAGAPLPRRAQAAGCRRRRRPTPRSPPPAVRLRARSCGHLVVLVVQVPPLVGRRLRVALRRVLPLLLASERGDVEVAPRAAHVLVTAVVYEIGTEDPVAVAKKSVRAVPLVHAEVGVEAVR